MDRMLINLSPHYYSYSRADDLPGKVHSFKERFQDLRCKTNGTELFRNIIFTKNCVKSEAIEIN